MSHTQPPASREGRGDASTDGRRHPASLSAITPEERHQARERAAITAAVVHEAVRKEGEHELERPARALAWSGLAAGLSMGFSLVGQGLLRAYLPDASWRPLVASLGYTLGFLIVVLGRQQLFTETTVTAILPLLSHFDRRTFAQVARMWAVVLATNVAGAAAFALVVTHVAVFPPGVSRAFLAIGREAVHDGFGTMFARAIFAGWLIALMVWLMPAADSTRLQIVVIVTYIVALGAFAHIIAGSVETLYLVWSGDLSVGGFLGRFFVPTLLGNIVGGVALVAALNFAQVAAESRSDHP